MTYITLCSILRVEMKNFILRKELFNNPEKFGLHLKSKNSASLIKSYEDKGLLPGSVTIGAGLKKGSKRAGYYYPAVLEMIRDIKNMKECREYTLAGIRKILRKRYIRVFQLMDILDLFQLRFLKESTLFNYIDQSNLTEKQSERIKELYEKKKSINEVKKSILEMLSQINIKSEVYNV